MEVALEAAKQQTYDSGTGLGGLDGLSGSDYGSTRRGEPEPANSPVPPDARSNSTAPATQPSASAYPPGPLTFVAGNGVYLTDDSGDQWCDAVAGTFNHVLGYAHPEVLQAITGVMRSGLLHVSSAFHHSEIEMAHSALVDVAPENLTRCHTKGSTGGSTAIEQAIRTAWVVTERTDLLAFRGGHHGQTIATTMVSGMPFRRNRIKPLQLPVAHVDPPDCYRCPVGKEPNTCRLDCIDAIEEAIAHSPSGEDQMAAMVAEPIMGAGGGITPPPNYWHELHARLQRRGVLLVFDEVQTFGRTGSFFAAQHYGVEPDMIVVAKGISGIGVAGAAALLMPEAFAVLNDGERALTGGSSIMAAAAISATVRVMNTSEFWERFSKSAEMLAFRLERMRWRFDCVGTVRGFGLMTGLEIVTSRQSRMPNPSLTDRIIKEAMRNRLLLRNSFYGRGSFLKIRPALTITCEQVNDLCDRLEASIVAAGA